MSLGYVWLYPQNGSCAIYKFVDDYASELKAGNSIYPDGRDFSSTTLPVVVEDETPKATSTYQCERCGREFSKKIALVGHLRGCQ